MMDNILDEAQAPIRRNLDILDGIEEQMVTANERAQVSKADVVTLNPEENNRLYDNYKYWQGRLSKQLDTPVNPYAPQGGMRGLNVKLGGR